MNLVIINNNEKTIISILPVGWPQFIMRDELKARGIMGGLPIVDVKTIEEIEHYGNCAYLEQKGNVIFAVTTNPVNALYIGKDTSELSTPKRGVQVTDNSFPMGYIVYGSNIKKVKVHFDTVSNDLTEVGKNCIQTNMELIGKMEANKIYILNPEKSSSMIVQNAFELKGDAIPCLIVQ